MKILKEMKTYFNQCQKVIELKIEKETKRTKLYIKNNFQCT